MKILEGVLLALAEKSRYRPAAVIAIAVLVFMPFVANLPNLSGFFNPDPIGLYAKLSTRILPSRISALSFIDPNVGFTSQALGHRAALDWLEGKIPWWNPYEGVGVPLAGEMQSAALFPLTLLLYFSNGQLYFHIILEIIAGLSTYFLLRRLSLSRWAALVGGVLFELNGTFAWLGHAPFNPVAFLPLLLLGVEYSYRNARLGVRYGWRWIAIAVALSLYAGFPETAYINAILAVAWIILRSSQLRPPAIWSYLAKIMLGGIVGLLLAAPILVAFFDYLREGFVGGHSGAFAFAYLPLAGLPQLVFPYLYGPIFFFSSFDHSGLLNVIWGNVGGYLTASLLLLIFIGLAGKRERALRFVLIGWIILALAKTFGAANWVTLILNKIPLISQTAFFRYSPPSWELAAILLAAFALDDTMNGRLRRLWLAVAVTLITLIALTVPALSLVKALRVSKAPHFMLFPLISIFWASIICTGILVSFFFEKRARAIFIGALLIVDALAMFSAPMVSNLRSFQIDRPAIKYMQKHIGLARFYTLGPIAPNYGSYFGLASINYNDLPIAARWMKFINNRLDSNADSISFTGTVSKDINGQTPEEALLANLVNYAWVGVKYVVTPNNPNPFAKLQYNQPKLAYHDNLMNIYELPNYQQYFTTLQNTAKVHIVSRTRVSTQSSKPTVLIRRELFFAGWHAYINGRETPISQYRGLFQAVRIPKGKNYLTFRYAPPHIEYAVVSFAGAVLFLFCTIFLRSKATRPYGSI